jgi:hypothetical protein
MSQKKNKGRNPPWTKFENVTSQFPLSQKDIDDGVQVWQNSKYVVQIDKDFVVPQEAGWPPMVHLSFKRHDRSHEAHDWRDMQRIKNELVGPECEGVELFPSESRLIDTSNQYHMYVFTVPKTGFPMGYTQRTVMEGNFGNQQRSWRPEDAPKDVLRGEEAINTIKNGLKQTQEQDEKYVKEKEEQAKKVPEQAV